jgi:mono/diheme cytochrome c family protein
MLRRWILAAALLAAAAPLHAQQPAPRAIQPDVLYHNYCSVCHGDRGDGRSRASNSLVPPPYDFTGARAKQEMNRDRIIAMVTSGKPGTAMVAWRTQLNEREIAALADYVLATFTFPDRAAAPAPGGAISGTRAHGGREVDAAGAAKTAAPPVAPPKAAPVKADMTAAFPSNLRGNADKGRTFYEANCATCHGKAGDGQGPRAYFINPKPRSFITADSRDRFNRVALFAAISAGRNGSEMPAWDKVLDAQQIADVGEYVFTAFIAPPAQAAKGK